MVDKPTYEELEQRVKALEHVELDRKKTEKELRDSEEELAEIFAMSLDLVCIADINDATFLKVNPSFTRILGYSEQELLNRPFLEFIHPDDVESTTVVIEKRLRAGDKILNFKNRYRCKDGTYCWLEWTSHPIPERGITFAVAHDITKRKRAEEALLLERDRAQQYLDVAGVMFVGLDRDQKVILVNRKGCEILGYPEDEIIGKNWFDHFLPGTNISKVKEVYDKIMSGNIGPVEFYENSVFSKDGSEKIVAWHNSIVRDESGNIIGLLSSGEDITERKRAEEALRKREERYGLLFNNGNDAVFVHGIGNGGPEKFTEVNDVACMRLGYSREELLRMSPVDIDAGGMDEARRQALKMMAEIGHCVFEMVHVSKSGDKIPVEISSRVFESEGKRHVLSITRDITDRKKATEEKKALEAQLHQAQKMEAIGTLAGGIAHDFNNILYPIIGFTEMMLDDAPEGSDRRESLNEVLIASTRAGDLVQQILTFSRQAERELKPLKTQIIVKEILKLMRASLPSTIAIEQHIDKDCGMVLADPTYIHQIAMNLITNAYHAMEADGGTLTIELSEVNITAEDSKNVDLIPGTFVCFSVSDTGPGIEKHILDRIFEPYFTTKDQGKGTGLGLSVVHGIVKSYKGDIRVYSEPGKGTVFNVYLPKIDSKREDVRSIMDHLPVQGGNEHILLVDDEETILKMEKQMLERLGYQVTSRTSSTEALEAFRSGSDRFDVVVTDMTMPNMTGEKLASELKHIRKEIPVILCTGFSEKISKEKADALGIDGFLMKPIAKNELSQTIRTVLDSIKGG